MVDLMLLTFLLVAFIPTVNVATKGNAELIGEINEYVELLTSIQEQYRNVGNGENMTLDEENAKIDKLAVQIDTNLGIILSNLNAPEVNAAQQHRIRVAILANKNLIDKFAEAEIQKARAKLVEKGSRNVENLEQIYGMGKFSDPNEKMTKERAKKLRKKLEKNIQNYEGFERKLKGLKKNKNGKENVGEMEKTELAMLEISYETKLIVGLLYEYRQHEDQTEEGEPMDVDLAGNEQQNVRQKRGTSCGCCRCGIPFCQIANSMFKFTGTLLFGYPFKIGKTVCYLGCQGVCAIWWSVILICVWPCHKKKANIFLKCKEPPATAWGMLYDEKVDENYEDAHPSCSCWPKMRTDIKDIWAGRKWGK